MTIQSVGVLGSGVMGGGIAQMFAENSLDVKLWDVEQSLADKGFKGIEKRLQKSVEKGKIDNAAAESVIGRIKPVTNIDDVASCDVIIEAVIEDFDIKSELYRTLETKISSSTIVGTNTSSLSVKSLSGTWKHPERFLGVHFFNPPTKLELVEVIMTDLVSVDTVRTIKEFLGKCGKTVVEVKDSPGFIVNRLLLPMINEAAKLVDSGVADIEAIDTAMCLGALHPAGPLQVADLIGLDVCMKILDGMAETLNNPIYKAAASIVDRVNSGRLGRKTGAGFYDY